MGSTDAWSLPGVERRRPGPWRAAALAVALLTAVCVGTLWAYVVSLGPLDLASAERRSTVVLDRDERLLRPFASEDGRWRLPIATGDVDPRFLAMLESYEDARFRRHSGVDLLALARAAGQLATHGRVISGGSTLTMQVARLLEPRDERSVARSCVRSCVPFSSSESSRRPRS
jgi:penicillin-binding protein 1C